MHLGVVDLSGTTTLSSIFPGAGSKDRLKSLLESPDRHAVTDVVVKEGPVVTTEQACILRAAAIDACQLIVEVARRVDVKDQSLCWINNIGLPELDTWIWAVAKDRKDYRELERFVLRDTVYF